MATTISFYDFAIRPHINSLRSAIRFTTKAQEHCKTHSIPETTLINARLYEDMYNFHGQIYQLAKATSQFIQRLVITPDSEIDGGDGSQVTEPPNRDGDNPKIETLQQCIDILTEALHELESPGPDSPLYANTQFARRVNVKYSHLPQFQVTKQQLVEGMVLPNIYFHTTTAYGILRSQGIPLGKGDYLRSYFEHAVDMEDMLKKAYAAHNAQKEKEAAEGK